MWFLFVALFLIALAFALYYGRICYVSRLAEKELPLLEKDPAAFAARWEARLKKAKLPPVKSMSLFLVASGLAHAGEPKRALERMRFVKASDRGVARLDPRAAAALYDHLLRETGNDAEADAVYMTAGPLIEAGSKSPYVPQKKKTA